MSRWFWYLGRFLVVGYGLAHHFIRLCTWLVLVLLGCGLLYEANAFLAGHGDWAVVPLLLFFILLLSATIYRERG